MKNVFVREMKSEREQCQADIKLKKRARHYMAEEKNELSASLELAAIIILLKLA